MTSTGTTLTGMALAPDELLTTTRTVRRRLDLGRPVPLDEVHACLSVARQAPCGSGRNLAHWVVITDPALRSAVGALYRAGFKALDSGRARGATRDRNRDSAAYLAEHMGRVPVLVLACVDTGGPLPEGSQASVWGSLLPAVWSYMLAARSRGLGTAWTTAHLRHDREIGRLLGLPDGVHQGALIPTAYYLGDTFRPARRPPAATTVHMNRW